MPNFNSGIGVLATYDVAGSGNLSTTNIGLLYSYDFNINKEWHIRPGVNFKFYYLGLDIGKLVFNSQITGSGTSPSVTPPPFDIICLLLKHHFMVMMPPFRLNLIFTEVLKF
jgi:hypothetical protein